MTYAACFERAKARAADLADRLNEAIYVIWETGHHVDQETGEDHGPYAVRDASELPAGAILVHTAHPQPAQTDPAEVNRIKSRILDLVNARESRSAEVLAAISIEDMDHATAEAFASWCANVGIR